MKDYFSALGFEIKNKCVNMIVVFSECRVNMGPHAENNPLHMKV